MADERLEALERLFHAARERDAAERAAFLDGACGDDLALRAEVESLLAHGERRPPADRLLVERGALQEGPGSRIGRYKLLQELGEGGFGVVYMAEQKEPVRRRVALKVIKLGMDTKQVIGRFEAERQALALMDHPNIAKVLDAGATATGRPYFVMELVRGVSITEYCDQAGMGTEERLRLFVRVCRAVQHAHQKGIVHRDLKPSNILVTLHDGEPVPKVIDFGIAKATNQELTERTVFTEFRQFIGTPEYMSPEQAEMSGLDVDTRADVYSLGVLLYELLTGTTPVDPVRLRSAGYEEMQRILREEEPVPPSTRVSTMGDGLAAVARRRHVEPAELSRALRGDLDWILLRALEKDRTRRYETASAFAQDVERHLADEPVVASPPSRVYRMQKFVRRNRRGVVVALALAALLLLGTLGTLAGFLRARSAWRAEQVARDLAETSAEAAREEAERQRALASFFEDSLVASTPWSFDGAAPAQVVDLLDAAAERLRGDELARRPVIRASLAQALGDAYMARDRWEDALAHFRLAIESLGSPEAAPLVWSRAARELDRVDAEDYFELDVGLDPAPLRVAALAALAPLVEARDPEVAYELFEWSHQRLLRGDPAEAARLLATLRELLAELPVPPDPPVEPAVVTSNLASAWARTGDDAAARRLYVEASEELRAVVARGDTEAADAWLVTCEHPSLGAVLEADPPIDALIELALARHEASNLARAEALLGAATILLDLGRAERGHELLLECVAVARGFDENRLMLGLSLAELAGLEWELEATADALAHAAEARELLAPTGGEPWREVTRVLVAAGVEEVLADPAAPGTAERVASLEALAEEVAPAAAEASQGSRLAHWWLLSGELMRLHDGLARARSEDAGVHARAAGRWGERLRKSLRPLLSTPPPDGYDIASRKLALGLLGLVDASPEELGTALALARHADEISGGRMARPPDLMAQALFRLGDVEGAVREARRARDLVPTSEPVRGLDERLARYEAALDAR